MIEAADWVVALFAAAHSQQQYGNSGSSLDELPGVPAERTRSDDHKEEYEQNVPGHPQREQGKHHN